MPTPLSSILRIQTQAGVNITGKSLNLRIRRGAERSPGEVSDQLGPGTLDLTVRDVALSPQLEPNTRPGKTITASVLVAGTWKPLVTTTIDKAQTTSPRKGNATIDVVLTALDNVAKLAATPVAQAYSGNIGQRLTKLLEGTGIAGYTSADYPSGPLPVVPITTGQTKNALEWLEILRDTFFGRAYVAADNAVLVTTVSDFVQFTYTDQPADNPDSPGAPTNFGNVGYTDIDLTFDTQNVVNALYVDRINIDEGEDGQKTYGPYKVQSSIDTWGPQDPATVTVTDGSPATVAETFLRANTTPVDTVRSVTFTVDPDVPRHLALASLELYGLVRVKHRTHDAEYRVIGIEHDITAKKWRITHILRPKEYTTGAVVTNPPGGANTGPDDITPPPASTHASRYRSTALAIANNTVTAVAFDAFDVEDAGLAYDATNRWFTASKDGLYNICATLAYQAGATGMRNLTIQANAITRRSVTFQPPTTAGVASSVTTSTTVRLAAGQRIAIYAQHTQGASLNLLAGQGATAVDITYLGP